MSHSDSPKQSSFFLWFIVPIAAMLTLMFVNINHNAAAPKTTLPGTVPAKEVEEKHEEHKAASDTTVHAEGAKAEEGKVEAQEIVIEQAPAPAHKGH